MFSPDLLYVVLDGTSYGPKVIETSTSSIDLKSLEVDVPPLDEVFEKFFIFKEFL